MHILILYNETAGRRNAVRHAKKIETALKDLQSNLRISITAVNTLETMRNFWSRNVNNPQKFDTVVIIGGDGTIGPNIDAMIKNNISIPFYAYGRGTANDFASYFKTNCSPKKAAAAILQNNITEVDTLKVNDKDYCINVACGGAFTTGVTNYNNRYKKFLGKFAYVMHAFFATFTLKSQLMKYQIQTPVQNATDTIELTEDTFLFYILNTRSVGGLKNSCPIADPSDGLLDLMIIKRCNLFARAGIKINQSLGRLHKYKHATHIRGTHFHITPVDNTNVIRNFTCTDTDGNPYEPYPLKVTLGPKVKLVTRKI